MAFGKCVYCLRQSENITDDHVFPQSWYPSSTPNNLEKWTVPACAKCNRDFGYIENELKITMGLCVDPTDIRAKGIAEKALRAIKESGGRDAQDKLRRRNKFIKTVRNFLYTGRNEVGIHPDFGPHADQVDQNRLIGLRLSAKFLNSLSRKIITGLYFVLEKKYIERPYILDVLPPSNGVAEYDNLVVKAGKKIDRGPGFEVIKANLADDPSSFVCKVTIWGKLQVRGTIMKREGLFAWVRRKILDRN